MNFARRQHTATVLQDGRVLVAGGIGASGTAVDTAELYDPTANTWTVTTGPLVHTRSGHTASLLQDGTVLVAGGSNSSGARNSLEIFNPVANAFTLYTAGDLSSARQNHAAAVLQDGRVIIIGGSDGTNVLVSTDIYDPTAGTIAAGPALSVARMNHTATTQLDGKVFVAGGSTIDGTGTVTDLASAEIWDPAAPQSSTFVALSGQLSVARHGHQAFLLPHNGGILIVGGSNAGSRPHCRPLTCITPGPVLLSPPVRWPPLVRAPPAARSATAVCKARTMDYSSLPAAKTLRALFRAASSTALLG